MSGSLRDALRQHLQGWQGDLPADWQAFIGPVTLAYTAVHETATLEPDERPIFPLRRGHGLAVAPAGSHVMRAFEGLSPAGVRAVVIGQDPYPWPRVSRATGRSFEPGDQTDWNSDTPKSLKRIVQVLARHRRPGAASPPLADAAWPQWLQELESGWVEPPSALFERWRRAGVLCLNLGMTFSRFEAEVQDMHMALWTPFIARVLQALTARPGVPPLAVMAWSGKAKSAVQAMGLPAQAVFVAGGHHPNAMGTPPPFYAAPNPFDAANRRLGDAGHPTIDW